MNKQTLISTILLGLLLVACCWLVLAQSEIDRQNKIIEIDQQIWVLNEEIKFHQSWYDISIKASEECVQSFLEDAQKEHIEADKKRELIKKLEEEKQGLLQNR